jgi:uncharacterized protein (TIGR02145 family)
MKNHIRALFLFLALFVSSSLHSQSPQGIPYQAVIRNPDGTVLTSSAVNLTFMIHDGNANGTVVYQESHALTSNAQGLVSCVVGNGDVSQGNFNSINWGNGAKFLHVMLGSTDLGTQQMLSVPYALYAANTAVGISATGDTLIVGGNSVIVPGISAANPQVQSNGGLGAQVLAGNTTCANEYISVTGCGGQTSLTYDGRTYDLVEIGGQCWFADNLATDQYRNGDIIGGYPYPNDYDSAYYNIYGRLYRGYAIIDDRGLCPIGWHVPSDCEWMHLEGSLGMSIVDQASEGDRGAYEGGSLKAMTNWTLPNIGATNSSSFNALPGGQWPVIPSPFELLSNSTGDYGAWWSSTYDGYYDLYSRFLFFDSSKVSRAWIDFSVGQSVRCIRD